MNGINISLEINSPVIEMNFDRNKIKRIVPNLISNAIKYNVENGYVKIVIDKITTPQGEQARIQVADSGRGIRDENKIGRAHV